MMRTLRIGMSGDDVRELQLELAKLGFALKGTGYFGPATDVAVETFQRRSGLVVDGEVGSETLKALGNAAGVKLEKPMPTIPLWLQVSLDHVGLKEAAGKANNKELVADIKTVAPDYQDDATPWCAGWVSFCLARAGLKPTKSPLWARSYAESPNLFHKLTGPAVGAIAVKTRTGGGHVTFVAGRTRGGALACCGGNQNDMVNVSPYAPTAFNLGFWWPKDVPPPPSRSFSLLPIVTSAGIPVTSES